MVSSGRRTRVPHVCARPVSGSVRRTCARPAPILSTNPGSAAPDATVGKLGVHRSCVLLNFFGNLGLNIKIL